MSIFLHALSLKFYRGIGAEQQRLTNFQDFNFFIGANNTGKSIVLNYLAGRLKQGSKGFNSNSIEAHRGAVSGELAAAIGIPREVFWEAVAAKITPHVRDFVKKVVDKLSPDGVVWLSPPTEREGVKYTDTFDLPSALTQSNWYQTWGSLTNSSQGDLHRDWIPGVLRYLLQHQVIQLPEVLLIPAKREIGPSGNEFNDLSGRGLIDRLAQIQSPDHDSYDRDRKQFAKINRFLETVTDHPGARIEVPHNRSAILVHMNNKVLPLASLGTGIHEVIMIAAFSTIHENSIMCIEEPEIHLHPILQRKLVRYLQENTTNQYFIATHSAAFIDTQGASVFHVSNDGAQTYITGTQLRSEKFEICMDLGYKASDLLQANCVIWVEGPSDRIYIRSWISLIDKSLIEGVHYSIMFYGGRLLSHLSGEPEGLNDFIQLRSLNRYSAIVIDSDMSSHKDKINLTKARLRDEFSRKPGFCWITKGREIENYIDHRVLQGAVKALYSDVYDTASDGGQFDHALYFNRKTAKRRRKVSEKPETLLETSVDKVAVAHHVCAQDVSLAMLDLRKQVAELVNFILEANHLH